MSKTLFVSVALVFTLSSSHAEEFCPQNRAIYSDGEYFEIHLDPAHAYISEQRIILYDTVSGEESIGNIFSTNGYVTSRYRITIQCGYDAQKECVAQGAVYSLTDEPYASYGLTLSTDPAVETVLFVDIARHYYYARKARRIRDDVWRLTGCLPAD